VLPIQVSPHAIGPIAAQTVNARDLHRVLGVRKDFSDWIKTQLDTLFTQGVDFETFPFKKEVSESCSPEKGSKIHGGSNRIEYVLTLRCAQHVALMSRTANGKKYRDYLLDIETRSMLSTSRKVSISGNEGALDALREIGQSVAIARQAFDVAVCAERAAAKSREAAQVELNAQKIRFAEASKEYCASVGRNLVRIGDALGNSEDMRALLARTSGEGS